jgi:hypothetical protein
MMTVQGKRKEDRTLTYYYILSNVPVLSGWEFLPVVTLVKGVLGIRVLRVSTNIVSNESGK